MAGNGRLGFRAVVGPETSRGSFPLACAGHLAHGDASRITTVAIHRRTRRTSQAGQYLVDNKGSHLRSDLGRPLGAKSPLTGHVADGCLRGASRFTIAAFRSAALSALAGPPFGALRPDIVVAKRSILALRFLWQHLLSFCGRGYSGWPCSGELDQYKGSGGPCTDPKCRVTGRWMSGPTGRVSGYRVLGCGFPALVCVGCGR